MKRLADVPRVPLEVAATGPRVIGIAARHADRVMFSLGADADRLAWGIEVAHQARRDAGLDPDGISFGAYLSCATHPSLDVAREMVRGGVTTHARFSVMHGQVAGPVSEEERKVFADVHDHYDMRAHTRSDSPQAAFVTPEFIERFSIVGSPDQCIARFRGLAEIGISKVVLSDVDRGADGRGEGLVGKGGPSVVGRRRIVGLLPVLRIGWGFQQRRARWCQRERPPWRSWFRRRARVPGDRASPTQPFPTKPAAYDRQGVSVDDLIDFTAELRRQALEITDEYELASLFTPPRLEGEGKPVIQLPADSGGTNWTQRPENTSGGSSSETDLPAEISVYDKKSGAYLGGIELPDSPNSGLVTYEVGGRQYLAVSVGGGRYMFGGGGTPPRVVALALGVPGPCSSPSARPASASTRSRSSK